MAKDRRYRAFISYSHADTRWAVWLQRSLESFRIPKALRTDKQSQGLRPDRLAPVFRDREDLASSSDLSASVRDALERSDNLIVLCSVHAARSPWVSREIEEYQRLGRSDRIFCLVVDPDPARPVRECLPPALLATEGSLGTGNGSEPVAADGRPEADGRRLARLKIIAGLLDVELDALRQRENQRRYRQLASVAAGSGIVALLMVALAISAFLAHNEADQRRSQAEGLLGFLVGDLRRSLQPIGRLDLLRSVGEQALDYFATVDVASLTDAELLRQAEVMVQLGEIQVDQLQFAEAREAFSQAYRRSTALWNNDPADGSRLFQRAQAEYWLGFVEWRNGNLNDARTWLTRYRDSAIDLTAMDPDRWEWVHELAYGYHNLAAVDTEAGHVVEAIAGFEHEVSILDDLLTLRRENDLVRDRADALSWLGTLHMRQGDLHRALDYFEESTEGLREALAMRSDDRNLQDDVAFSLLLVSETSMYLGRYERARAAQTEAEAIFGELVVHDPENLNWRRGQLKSELNTGWLAAASGDWGQAERMALETVSALEAMAAGRTAGFGVRDLLMRARVLLALSQEHGRDLVAALQTLENPERLLDGIDVGTRVNEERLGVQATALLATGDIHRAQGEPERARVAWQRGIEGLELLVPDSRSPFLLDPWARLNQRLGRLEEASSARRLLDAAGYRPPTPWEF